MLKFNNVNYSELEGPRKTRKINKVNQALPPFAYTEAWQKRLLMTLKG